MTIAAVIAIETPAGCAPGTARILTVAAVQPYVTGRSRTATGIDGQHVGIQLLEPQVQVTAGRRRFLERPRCAARSDLRTTAQIALLDLQLERLGAWHDSDARLMTHHQLSDSHFGQSGRDQQGSVIGHFQTVQLHDAGIARQAHQRMRLHRDALSHDQGAAHGRQQACRHQ